MISRFAVILLAALALSGAPASAQQDLPTQFSSGDDYFPVEVYLSMHAQGAPSVLMFPGEGLSGTLFRDRPDGGPSWFGLLNDDGMNALSVDWPGTGNAQGYLNRDLIRALQAHVQDAYLIARGALAQLTIGYAEGCALITKCRSFGDYLSPTAVFIDPIGPQYAQPLEPLTFDQALARQATFEDDLWRRLGFGPRAGVLADGLDIDLDTANAVFAAYQRDAFAIRPALLQPMISPIRVRGTGRLKDWRVLIVRTPAADEGQVRRETEFAAWLETAGVHVDRLDLASDPELSGTTALPWIGAQAPAVLERIVEWYREAIQLIPELRDLDAPGQS